MEPESLLDLIPPYRIHLPDDDSGGNGRRLSAPPNVSDREGNESRPWRAENLKPAMQSRPNCVRAGVQWQRCSQRCDDAPKLLFIPSVANGCNLAECGNGALDLLHCIQ